MTKGRFTLRFEVQECDHGKMIREYLKEKEISKTALTDIKYKGGRISVNGVEVNVRKVLEAGEILLIEFPEEKRSEGIPGEPLQLEILYEDDFILVVNKPPGMNTIPSREHPRGSLANAITGYYEEIGLSSTAHVVTRLDRDTSGVVLIAKHRHVHHLFSKQQQERKISRVYEAFAEGEFLQTHGLIEEPIARKMDSIIEREVNSDGQYALTHYIVVNQYSSFAHVRLIPETGRTHQLRVHLSYLGHPLLGDNLYGGPLDSMKRQALHCGHIRFFHPILGEEYVFTAPLPEDMQKLIEVN